MLLAFTIKELLQLQPHLEVIIAGVVRKADSFELFLSECSESTRHARYEQFQPLAC